MYFESLAKVNERFIDEFKKYQNNIFSSGHYILGEYVKKFEKAFAQYHDIPYCVGVGSGTDALILSLKALNLPQGSEVIIAANAYIATVLSILHNDLVPVFVEPDIHTYNIDPKKIEKKITKNTKAILALHLYGKMCDMQAIMDIAQKYNLFVIEDCAQSHGSMFKNKKAGSWGDIAAFSFYPTKNLGAIGDAGAIITKHQHLYERLLDLRNYGFKEKFHSHVLGYNSRLDEIQAAFLLVKLQYLDEINNHKRHLAHLYIKYLNDKIVKPAVNKDYYDNFHLFVIRYKNRNELQKYLSKHNIPTMVHYPVPPYKQLVLKDVAVGHYPISDEIHNTVLSLPLSYSHTEEEILKVIEIINNFLSKSNS